MKGTTISKINKLGKVGFVICKICKILFIIIAVASLFSTLFMLFQPRTVKAETTSINSVKFSFTDETDIAYILMLSSNGLSFEYNGTTYNVIRDKSHLSQFIDFNEGVLSEPDQPAVRTTTFYPADLKWMVLAFTLLFVVQAVVFHLGCKLCEHFKNCTTPFTAKIAKGFSNLAWGLTVFFVLNMITMNLRDSIIMRTFKLTTFIDIESILLVVCIFMLSYIFKHGTALQTESDQTL